LGYAIIQTVFLVSNPLKIKQIEGKVWSISEVPLSVALKERTLDEEPSTRKNNGVDIITSVYNVCNELSTQHFLPPRRFLLLTNTGLHVLVKRRPIDILEQLLLLSQGKDTQELIVCIF